MREVAAAKPVSRALPWARLTSPRDVRVRSVARAWGLVLALVAMLLAESVSAQANGRLQLHFIDVGQGDGALLISPNGETVLFDDGVLHGCDKPVAYLGSLGLQGLDYHIASHYHADHIGCARQVFAQFPLQKYAYDRGETYGSATFTAYRDAVGAKRRTATTQTVLTLDAGASQEVKVRIAALNGNWTGTKDENDKSVVAVVTFGNFSAVIGGDLSGYSTEKYKDIETDLAPSIGEVDVYKVHHHGSRHSTNETWLQQTKPAVGIISAGEGNSYGHPTGECLERLHTAGVRTFWTSGGNGAPPDANFDFVGGTIVVESAPGADVFTVRTTQPSTTTTFSALGQATAPVTSAGWVWSASASSEVYHFAGCGVAGQIAAHNRREGPEPPEGRRLHKGCPAQ